uniref:DUF3172 domain-containing protein n=1 Tax=Oculatella sp. LEGE 06141 TaxID=1828648 RepID=UPI0030DB7B68
MSGLNYIYAAILGGIFILGIGIGIAVSSTANFSPENVASRDFIDRSAPNAEMCVQYGASAVSMDLHAFLTLSPFSVYVSQPLMQPGCVLRSSNWAVLQRNNLVSQEEVNDCRRRMNTFGFTGSVEGNGADPKIYCVYQNDSAQNLFLNGSGGNAVPESDRF